MQVYLLWMDMLTNERTRLLKDNHESRRRPKISGSKRYGSLSKLLHCRRPPEEKEDKAKSAGPKTKTSIRQLFRYATWLDYVLLLIGSVSSIVTGAGFPFLSIIFGGMTNSFLSAQISFTDHTSNSKDAVNTSVDAIATISKDAFHAQVVRSSWLYAAVGFAVMICSYIQFACWSVCCERQIHRIRRAFFKAILRQEISWFDERQSGELITKLSDDLERIKEGIGDKFGLLLQYIFQLLAGFVVAFLFSWKLSLVMLAVVPLMALSAAFVSKMITQSTRKEQTIYASAGAVAEEVLSCIRTVIAFNGQTQEVTRFGKELSKGKRVGIMKSIYMSVGFALMFFFMFASYALALWYGSILIVGGELDRGTVFIVLSSVMMGSFALGNAAPLIGSLAAAKGASASILSIIDSIPSIDSYTSAGKRFTNPKGRIEFEDVHFAYPTRKSVAVLNGLSFEVKPGQTVALVGSSGCGKSTVISLLLRYYKQDSGKIKIDGREIDELNLRWLRNIIGVVSQEPILFDLSIEENIRYGRMDADLDQIMQAAKMSNAHMFISKLPNGYKTMVGERGTQLSGGQKQRIAIARALVRDPKILLLDEATSALDSESESLVQEALDKAREGRTTIVIAHRLATVKNANKILVLSKGQIVEHGTHEKLMAAEGIYYDLVTAQSLDDAKSDNDQDSDVPESQPIAYERFLSRNFSIESQQSLPMSRKSTIVVQSTKRKHSILSPDSEHDRLVEELQEENARKATLLDILKANKPEWLYIFVGLIGAAIRGCIMPSFAFFYTQIFRAYSKTGTELRTEASFWSLMFIVLGIVMALSTLFTSYFFGLSAEELTMRLRLDAFKNVLRQSVAYFDNPIHSTGRVCTRLSTDAPNIKAAVDFRLSTVLASIVSMLTGIIIAFIYGWKLAFLLVVLVPFIGFSGYLNIKLRHKGQLSDSKMLERAGKIATEGIENVRTVQALTREKTFYQRFCEFLQEPYKRALAQTQLHSVSYAFAQSLMFFLYAACFRFGGYLIEIGDMQALDVFMVFFAITFSGMTVSWATAYFPDLIKAKFSAGLVFKMIKEEPIIDSYSKGGIKAPMTGKIDFTDIHFVYPMRPEVTILRNFDLKVSEGQTVALVGPSGCGKSTIVCLLERFYDPIDGRIEFDGNDFRTLNLPNVRRQIALVSQEPILFNCSILDNIMYGLEDVPYNKIIDSAKLANIHQFIMTLPDGYKTKVGEKGVMLSGGQKQRIAIARALIRDPKILILDEATSALDTESEKLVQEALDRAKTGRTCIVIAHRLSTVQKADKIAVIKGGRVFEQGTHSELINKRGIYHMLTQKQNLGV